MSAKALHRLGYVLLAWGALNTGVDILRYGFAVGHYWWFCNLALVAMGYGLVRDDRGLITAFLAIASYTQTFWLVDNLSVLFGGEAHFGLIDYLYQPGFPMDEFVLAHYHYFTLPIGFAALLVMPAGRDGAVKKAAILNPLIFAVSYFAFGSGQNVNCIQRSCFPGMESWSGPLYSIAFWLLLFSLNLLVAWLMESHLLPLLREAKPVRRQIGAAMGAVCVLALGLFAMDVSLKSSLPVVECAQSNSDEEASVGCRYISSHGPQELLVAYRASNRSPASALCEVEMVVDGKATLLHEQLPLEPHSHLDYMVAVARPEGSARFAFQSRCH